MKDYRDNYGDYECFHDHDRGRKTSYFSTGWKKVRQSSSRISDWIFTHIDCFFQDKSFPAIVDQEIETPSGLVILVKNNYVWELNQGVGHIIMNDIRQISKHLMPRFLKRFLLTLYYYFIVYLFTDIADDDERKGYLTPGDSYKDPFFLFGRKVIRISAITSEQARCKFMSVRDWWREFFLVIRMYVKTRAMINEGQDPGTGNSANRNHQAPLVPAIPPGHGYGKLVSCFTFYTRI